MIGKTPTEEYLVREAKAKGIRVEECDLTTYRADGFEAAIVPIAADEDQEFDEEKLLRQGTRIAGDLVHVKSQHSNPPTGFYRSEFVLESEETARLVFLNVSTGRYLPYELVFDGSRGLRREGASTVGSEFDVFVLQQYTEWCGKWHGKKKKWKICAGKDCPGGGLCLIWQRKWV